MILTDGSGGIALRPLETVCRGLQVEWNDECTQVDDGALQAGSRRTTISRTRSKHACPANVPRIRISPRLESPHLSRTYRILSELIVENNVSGPVSRPVLAFTATAPAPSQQLRLSGRLDTRQTCTARKSPSPASSPHTLVSVFSPGTRPCSYQPTMVPAGSALEETLRQYGLKPHRMIRALQ